MSLFKVFDVAGSAMQAQSMRLNTVASNLANASAVSGTEAGVYRAKKPVFETMMLSNQGGIDSGVGSDFALHHGVRVSEIVESDAEVMTRYEPKHPLADDKGYVYYSNVNAIEEVVDMMSASRSFQSNTEVLSTTKRMMVSLLEMGN
ncbi:MAG: flagellar basal body rod protein FlgC [Sinobacterium sp.]|nr:flagellar basal body rod protein FlgC [Sinobacterium sp.]